MARLYALCRRFAAFARRVDRVTRMAGASRAIRNSLHGTLPLVQQAIGAQRLLYRHTKTAKLRQTLYRSIGEMSVPPQTVRSSPGARNGGSLAASHISLSPFAGEGGQEAAVRFCGRTANASSAEGGVWARTAAGVPYWSFCLWLRTRRPQASIASPTNTD